MADPVGSVDHGANPARFALLALGNRCFATASTHPRPTRNRHVSRRSLDRRGSLPHVWRALARHPGVACALRIPRTQRAHLCRVRRQTRRLVLQPRRRKRDRRLGRSCLVPSLLFHRTHALRKSRWLDRIQQRTHSSRRRKSQSADALSPIRRNLPRTTRHSRTFPNRTLLPLCRRCQRTNLAWRNPAWTVAAAAGPSRNPPEHHDRSCYGMRYPRAAFTQQPVPPKRPATSLLRSPRRGRLEPTTNLIDHEVNFRNSVSFSFKLCDLCELSGESVLLLTTCETQKTRPAPCTQTQPDSST